ncbi:germination protein YpeB [Pseudoneobacillus sp. C159]
MIRGILIGLLSLGVAGTAIWGYQEHREKNAVLINAENNYQRAFHNLSYRIDLLNDKIGTTLAMNSRSSLSPALADVWRITSEAHSDVGQLPLTLLPFNKTEEFLAKIGDFSYRTAVRDLDKEPLTDEEYKHLKTLYKQSGEIQNSLREVQHLVIKNNLRWMDVELALATNEPGDNTVIDGFKTVEKTVSEYDEVNLGPAFTNLQEKDENFRNLKGPTISKKEALKIAQKYSNLKNGKVQVVENGDGSKYGFYSVSILEQKSGLAANMDITKVGGYPIWYIMSRDIKKGTLGLNEASQKAIKFLGDNGFKDLDLFESSQYDHIGVFTFVSKVGDVRVYPDSIKVKIALDNGDMIGLAAGEYLKSHRERKIPQQPLISEKVARTKINPNLDIQQHGLAVIMNDLNQEVFCHEFLGTLGDDTYRIFINAETGFEEKVDKLQNAEPIYEDVL